MLNLGIWDPIVTKHSPCKLNIFEKKFKYICICTSLNLLNLSLQKDSLIHYGKCWKDCIGLSKVELWYPEQFNLCLLMFN